MAQPKQSARQVTDAAVITVNESKKPDTGPTPRRVKGTRPDNFVGDRKGFFRGARVRG